MGSIPTLVRVFLCPCVGPFPSVGLTLLVLVHVHCRDFNTFTSHGLLPSDLVAQSVERRRSNPKVVGSIPTLVRVFLCPCVGPFPSVGLTLLVLVHVHCRDFNTFTSHGLLPSDLVAQSVERRRSNPKVVGSIPTLVRVFLCPCVGPFPCVGLTLTWFIWD